MELCRDVQRYVRWQQSRQVKATLSPLKTTCKLPTCSLAPSLFFFCFSSDRSPCCYPVANPPTTTTSALFWNVRLPSGWFDERWGWLQSEGPDKQLRTRRATWGEVASALSACHSQPLLSIRRLPDLRWTPTFHNLVQEHQTEIHFQEQTHTTDHPQHGADE